MAYFPFGTEFYSRSGQHFKNMSFYIFIMQILEYKIRSATFFGHIYSNLLS